MIFVILNFLFNGFILGNMLIISFAIFPFHINHSDLFYMTIGYLSSGLLVLIGITGSGQFLLRLFIGARNAIGRERKRIEPILTEVIEKANAHYKTEYKLENFKIMVADRKDMNSAAFGENTIIVNDGLLRNATDGQLAAILAHELGHLHYKDSVRLIAILFSSFATRICIILFGLYVVLYNLFISVFDRTLYGIVIGGFLLVILIVFLPIVFINWVGGKLLNFTMLFINRSEEYRADKFAYNLGYGAELIAYLDNVQTISETDNSILGIIYSTHPAPMKRIGKLEDNLI